MMMMMMMLMMMMIQAEYARGEGQTKVIVRAPHPGRPTTWTGEGFMEVHEGDKIDFEISNLGQSMEYEIVVRYEPQVGFLLCQGY